MNLIIHRPKITSMAGVVNSLLDRADNYGQETVARIAYGGDSVTVTKAAEDRFSVIKTLTYSRCVQSAESFADALEHARVMLDAPDDVDVKEAA